ncbi:glycosyltransferase family 2 protein [Qipengyuania gaetbuli]|uniref:glycosyltransferase family 2 protein n=1 Tax=Qipengyuania gaetbuli TaxID=266952 RepID=UPI001CD30ABE|nr:glycosyltransferase family 2 protein [Qipengyuania gaetbuli]MCA0911032.1 glycosyltransferase [Qipengyuania gaetbuli]
MSADSLKVTVIICAYNAASTIRAAIESLQIQTARASEILVIDDASSDDTIEVVESIMKSDPTVRLLRNDENRGTAFSRQRGLNEAGSDFVMFLDADDMAEECLVERLQTTLRDDPNIIGVGSYATYVSASNRDLGIQKVGPESRCEFERMYNDRKLLFMAPTTLFRKSDALRVGGYRQDILPNEEGIRYQDFAEDLDLWCRMSDLGASGRYFLTLPEPLFRYRKPEQSLSTKNLKLMQLKMRWIKDCLRRRRYGQSEESLASFIASRTVWDRLNDWRSDSAAAWYKKAGFAWMRRDWLRLAIFLGLSGAFSPKLIRQKLKTQTASR